MTRLRYISVPVLRNDLTTWACHFLRKTKKNSQKCPKMTMHCWCTFGYFQFFQILKKNVRKIFNHDQKLWCTFDALLKVHQNDALLIHFHMVLMHFWCAFKSASKVHHIFWSLLNMFLTFSSSFEKIGNIQTCTNSASWFFIAMIKNTHQKSWHHEYVLSQWLMAFTHLTYHR